MKQKYLAILGCIGILFGSDIAAAPDPADPDTAIPASVYVSPFSDYRPLGEDKNTIWKDANDTVRRSPPISLSDRCDKSISLPMKGTQAFEWTGALAEPARFKSEGRQSMPLKEAPKKEVEITVKKPSGGAHGGH